MFLDLTRRFKKLKIIILTFPSYKLLKKAFLFKNIFFSRNFQKIYSNSFYSELIIVLNSEYRYYQLSIKHSTDKHAKFTKVTKSLKLT